MDFASYYLELFDMLNQACRKIASGHYDQKDAERLFELAKRERYPSLLADLAEAFGMMMVKVEAREFSLKQALEDLEQAKSALEERLACDRPDGN
jgi:HEPN domain-containing protein